MSTIPEINEEDESELYIDETSQMTNELQIDEDEDNMVVEHLEFDEDEEEIGFSEEVPLEHEEPIREKVLFLKVPEYQLEAGASIKKMCSASDTTTSKQSLPILKLPNPNVVAIKEVTKVNLFLLDNSISYFNILQENLGIKMVSPKGMNFTLISKKPIDVPVSKGEFLPMLPKIIPTSNTGNILTTITSSGVGPIRCGTTSESIPHPTRIIKVGSGEYKTLIGATVITQKPMPTLQSSAHNSSQIPTHTSSPNMIRPVTIKPIPNTHIPQTMTITKGPPPKSHQTISVADSSKITISKKVSFRISLKVS